MLRSPPRQHRDTLLNGICPYFTMFPLDFPLKILQGRAREGHRVIDPFCGRGTTSFAARILGIDSLGVDSNPVATAITASKLVSATADAIFAEAKHIICTNSQPKVPQGEFWEWAYHPEVLQSLSRFRASFLEDCSTEERIALRGIILGALHGPLQKTSPSYFSNQSPRTYAPKPSYAVRFWKHHMLIPSHRDILRIVERRAYRYYSTQYVTRGAVRLADSRAPSSIMLSDDDLYDWVITSPPYYGMRTYISDQWLRHWFLGGPDTVDYSCSSQVSHSSPEEFANNLRMVWQNVAHATRPEASLIVRFGGISDRRVEPLDLLMHSLEGSGWLVSSTSLAGSAHAGKRQADTFLRKRTKPITEYDVWATKG